MSLTTYSTVADALSLLLARPLANQINTGSVLLHLLPHVRAQNKNVSWTAKFTNQSNAVGTAETATYTPSDGTAEIEKLATLEFAKYEMMASVSGKAEAAAAATSANFGAQSLVGQQNNLLAARARDSYMRTCRGIQTDLYGGQSAQTPEEITGLAEAVDSSGTYAGIARNTYTEWAATEASVSAANLTFGAVSDNLIRPIYNASGSYPTVLVADSTTFGRLRNLYGSGTVPYIREIQIPAMMSEDSAIVTPERTVKLAAGMRAFLIDDVPVILDRDCTANTIYGLNLGEIWIEQLMPAIYGLASEDIRAVIGLVNPKAAEFLTDNQIAMLQGAATNPTGIVPKFKLLGAVGDQESIICTSYAQLVVRRPNAHGKLAIT